ncbi:MAG: hypothetical protein GY711_08350, partial [bacterium]|nr:hypothetical protein [bacterium]
LFKVLGFFGVAILVGRFIYPRLTLPFRAEGGKGFTFVLFSAFAMGLFAEAIGLHMILGAYLAGLFFEEKVAHPNLVRVVMDRAYGIAYSFLGPIFFISLGFSITFDISASGFAFLGVLTLVVIVGQILSAGGMALQMRLPWREALTVGVGMCGRAELAFILASLALAHGAIDQSTFSVLIFTAFVLNLFTPLALKGCATLLGGTAVRRAGATRGVLQIDKFNKSFGEERFQGVLPHALPDLEDGVVIYGYGPEVDTLLGELDSRGVPSVVIEEDEAEARRLQEAGRQVVHARLVERKLELGSLVRARALIANGADDANAVFALEAREQGFKGPIVVIIRDRRHRAPTLLAGATATFTPAHMLAAAIAARGSARISPRVTGVETLSPHIEVMELRVNAGGPLVGRTLAETDVRRRTGANIVGQWLDDELRSPPHADQPLEANTILVGAGSAESMRRLGELARPIAQDGPIVVAGLGDVGKAIVGWLRDAGETVRTIDAAERTGVDIVGDVLERETLERAAVTSARAVILTLNSDTAAHLAATVVRDFAPHATIIVGVKRVASVERIQRAGADFALSISQVCGQLLAHHVLGETVSLLPRIRLVKTRPGSLVGEHPLGSRIRERTRCSVVAVERGGELMMDSSPDLRLREDDALYICGTINAVNRYYDEFPASRL